MYKDIIRYELAENVTESQLFEAAEKVKQEWMSKLDGFIKWEIHKNKNEEYVDIVYWESREAAKNAEARMGEIPNGQDWFACYKEGSIKSENLNLLSTLN